MLVVSLGRVAILPGETKGLYQAMVKFHTSQYNIDLRKGTTKESFFLCRIDWIYLSDPPTTSTTRKLGGKKGLSILMLPYDT